MMNNANKRRNTIVGGVLLQAPLRVKTNLEVAKSVCHVYVRVLTYSNESYHTLT